VSSLEVWYEALRALAASRLRTSLTMLGVVIGIASVALMLSVGDAIRGVIAQQLKMLGSNQLIVQPGTKSEGGVRRRMGDASTLTLEDAVAIGGLDYVAHAAPVRQGYFQVVYGGDNSNATVMGVTTQVLPVRDWSLARGVFLSDDDIRSAGRVAIIGSSIATEYYYRRDPIGQVLRINGHPFTIIGVLSGRGRMLDGSDLGELVVVPITSFPMAMPLPNAVHYVMVQVGSERRMSATERGIMELMRARHHKREGGRDDFAVTNLATIAHAGAAIGIGVSAALGIIGAISLLVGGIGIMNIMLANVSERVREIGVRMAVGARSRDILEQFLVEAVALCLIGGLAGLLLAFAAAQLVTHSGKFELVVSGRHVAIAMGFAASVGIVFGFYPALRASRLSPVECLRSE